jgi:hypothetical protein
VSLVSRACGLSRLDRRKYPTGHKFTAEEMKQVNIYPDKFHGEWNYVIKLHHTALPVM